MSYTSEYYNALAKLKKRKEDTDGLDDYTAEYYRALNDIQSRQSSSRLEDVATYDDIAPTRGGDKDSWFKAGAFDDGYQFGDVMATFGSTVMDAGTSIVKGAGRLVEGIVDLGTYGVAGAADLLGADDFADKTRKVAQYSATDEWTKDWQGFWDSSSLLGNKADQIAEGLGQVGAIILTGGAGAAAGLGTAGVTALTTAVTGLSGMGSGMSEAYELGATDEEAAKYGAVVGSVEAASELIFGGLGKGVKALGLSKGLTSIDDIAAKKISNIAAKYITSEAGQKVVGNTLEWAVKSGAEGLEEVISGFGSAIAKDVYLYNDENEKPFIEILADENLLEQFVVGSITSSIAQSGIVPGMKSGSLREANKTGRDFVTGYTASDQAVIDKVVENRVAEAEKDGKKLSKKEIGKIEEQVQDALEKGQLDIDTIESVLGGETYTAYKDNLTETAKLKQEYDKLSDIKESDLTRKQKKRLDELEAMNLDDTTKSDGLRQQLDNKLKPLLKNSKLTETYNERARRGQAFEADLTKYKGKQREAVERAINSGVLNNTYRSHELVNVLSKIEADKGVIFDYTNNAKLKESGFVIDGKTVNGFVKDGNVTLNVQSSKAWQSTVGHEITHVLEGTESYSALQSALFKYAESKGEYQSRYDSLAELYNGVKGYETDFDTKLKKELTADLVGDYLFTDQKFIQHLTGDRNLFQKVYDEIKYLCKIATGKELTEIEKVKREFDNAWKQMNVTDTKNTVNEVAVSTEGMTETDINDATEYSDNDVTYSLREGDPPKETGIAYKVFFVKDGKLYPPMVANPDGADTPIGVWLDADVGTSAPPTKTGRAQVKAGGKGTQGGSGSLSFRPGWHLGDLPRASQFDRVNPETGKKELFPSNFVWAEVEYAKDVDYQEEAMSYGYTENGKFRHSYAGLPKLPENGYYRYRTNPKPDTVPWIITGAMKVNRLLSDAEVNAILEQNGVAPVHRQGGDVGLDKFGFDESGNVKCSVSPETDSDYMSAVERGDTETAQRLVDEAAKNAGYGIKAYHGTGYDFTVFDKSKQGDNYQDWGRLGKGFYFAPTSREAETWAELSKGGKNKVMPVYLRSDNMLDSFEALPDNLKDTIPENWDSLTRRLAEKYAYNFIEYMQEFGYNVQEILTEKGYDGINGHTEFVVFDPEQVKSADAVTYDDNGNVIPLSERFNTANEDIRYSLSSMANTFYGDENMSSVAFEEGNYKETDGYKNYVEQCVNNMRQTRADFDEAVARQEIEDQIDGIVRVALAAKRAGYDILDDASKRDIKDSKNRLLFSSLEPNSDYFTSSDISTICDKRKNFAEIYDEIVRTEEAKGVPQGKRFFDNVDNYFVLHKIMADKGLTQPCRQCYVESMRKNLAPMANAFLKLVNETDANNKANDQLYQPKGKNKGELKANNALLRERVLEIFEEHPEYNMSVGDLTVETLTTEDGLAQLKIQAPLVYEAFNSFYGQSKPKMPKSATPFRFGELTALLTDEKGKIKQSLVDKINSTGGFRLQSYSDFQIQNYTDVLQVIFEAGTLGLNGHAYTKVPAFLEATEGTNLKRNISIFMYKDGNEWKLDKNDSFPANTLEEIYDIVNADTSGNTGIIAVSQNKDMSCWIMANDYVAYGIPFHKSGLKMGTVRDTDVKTDDGRIIKGYSGTIDHTKQQTEVWAKANADHKALTKVKKGINIYEFWDFDNKANLSKNKLIEKNVKAYIDACEKAGYLPKFRGYVMNNDAVLNDVLRYSKELGFMPQSATIEDISFEYKGYTIPYGYYKFLGDFSMFAPDGNASPHETLSLNNYDFDKAEDFFADAEGLRKNEILQQFANGEERQKYRDSDLNAEQLTDIVNQKRKEVAESIVAPVKNSLSNEGERFNTANEDFRFSLSESVEETNDLIAVHNLKANELLKTLELGGLPMPSIAIIKAEQEHEKYGDVSLIFPRQTIDPKASSANKVYGGDAWTPTYPRIEYKARESVSQKIKDKYYELADKIGYDAVRPMYRYVSELDSALNSEGGEANLLNWLYDDTKMMQVYLEDSGKGKVEDVIKETRTEATESEKEMNQWFIDKLGEDVVRSFKAPEGVSPLTHRKEFMAQHGEQVKQAYRDFFAEKFGFDEDALNNIVDKVKQIDLVTFMRKVESYLTNGGITIKTETDYDATDAAIREKAADGYQAWVDDLFKGVEEKTGIRNDKDAFTSRGDRRSWDALHWENTLENVVKAMKAQDQTGADAFSPASAIFAVAHKRYGSVEDIKADSDRLGRVSEEEYKAMEESYASRLAQIAKSIQDPSERNQFIASDEAASQIVDAVRNYKTKSGMLRYMQKWNSRVTESTVDDILSLVSDIANMPTGYFEAKPQRAVGLEEVGVFVIPNNADTKLKQELLNKGYSIAEYDPNVEGDRKRVVNQFEEYKFSLSNEGEEFAPIGNYSTPLSDTALEDIAPVREGIAVNATTTEGNNAPAEEAPQTVDEKISAKLKNLQTELDNNKKLRDESNADFDSEIARLQAEYDAKKDKNTKTANNLLRRIERMQRLKANVNADYESRISTLSERVNKVNTPQYKRGEQRRIKEEQRTNEISKMIGDTSSWQDKKLGISYQTNTLHRNLRDVVRDANGKRDIAKSDEIYEYLQGSYNRNEAELKRESQAIKQKYADMKINKYESAYIQMLGEFQYNPETKLTQEVLDDYFDKHGKRIDIDKVKKAIEESRKDYDSLIKRVNAVLREQGMKEIGYKEGYYPHFTDTKQSWLAKLFNWKTIDTEIPTDIAGLTEDFEPVRTYQSFDKQRKSDVTDYNFLKGFDTYVHGALDWIYHIEDIQKRRAFENEIRYSHSEQGVRDRIDEIRKNKELDADEVQALIDNVYKEAKNPLNNFVTDLRNSTNNLAGKKSTADRSMEYATNRKVYSTMTNISNRVSGNMVAGSISSALTNFIPITQSWGQVSPVSSLRAVGDVVRNAFRNDGMIEKSTFMTNRLMGEENLYQTGWDKASKVAGGLMDVIDQFTTQVVWRSKYIENMNSGMSEVEAINNADVFAENVMAGRSRGNMPTIYNSKDPVTKMLTAFQLEVANQYGYMFKDMPQDIGSENIGKLAKGYATMFIGAYVYNALFSKLTGRDAAFDPIGILEDLMKDLGFGSDDEEEEADVLGAVKGLGENILQEVPYVSGLLGGGRVPISSALPYDSVTKMVTGTIDDVANEDWANLTNEWLNPVYYLALPFGGGQIKKTNEGLGMFSDEHPVSGSYTTSGNLRFPVADTPLNRLQAGLFGQYASENAREYFDNDYAPLKEKQIQEYIDVDIPIKEYWEYREGLTKQNTLEDKFDYISGLDLPIDKKNILINNVTDRKEKVDLTGYEDFSSLEEFDFANKYPDKYALSKSLGGYSFYKTYTKALNDITADKDSSGKSITGSRKEKVLQYINNLDADYETKILLYKSEYPSDDTYNAEIINYLNNRSDLTYDDRVAVLTALGFRVVNGQIYAD